MDEEPISNRFWFEHESGRRLYPVRQKNQKTGRISYRIGKGAGANRVVNQHELDDIEDVYRKVFNDGWLVRMRARDGWNGMYGKDGPSIIRTSEDGVPRLTAATYREALRDIQLSTTARDFLIAHYYAANRQASMESLAEAVGYDTHAPANLHYGAFAHKLAETLPAVPSDVLDGEYDNWMQAIASSRGERNQEGHFLWTLRPEVAQALEQLGWVSPDGDDPAAPAVSEVTQPGSTTREAVVQARRGQGLFRRRVLQYWGGRCAVSGCMLTSILVASHIKPWSDSGDAERLDGFNGLLLTPNLDKLFDAGLIGFADDRALLVSEALAARDAEILGVFPGLRLRRLHARHRPFLAAHRDASAARGHGPLKSLAPAGNIKT